MRADRGAHAKDLELEVTVRSTGDPHVVALEHAGCDLDFGPTAAELRQRARAMAIVGAVLMSPAVLAGGWFVCSWWCRRERGRGEVAVDEEGKVSEDVGA